MRLRHGGADVRHLRRSLPEAQDRAVLPGGGGGVPCAWDAVCMGSGATRCIQPDTTRTDGWRWWRTASAENCCGKLTMAGRRGRRRCSGRRRMRRGGGYGGPSNTGGKRLDGYRRRTQGRRLERAGRLTGVSGGLKKREREQIATRLGVATMTVLSGAHRWGRSWQSRGAAIVAVLVALACSATLGDRMGALVRSAICGGHRARGWWRAGSRPARAGWWPRAAVPKRGNRALPAALGNGHRRPRKRPFEPSRTALR